MHVQGRIPYRPAGAQLRLSGIPMHKAERTEADIAVTSHTASETWASASLCPIAITALALSRLDVVKSSLGTLLLVS